MNPVKYVQSVFQAFFFWLNNARYHTWKQSLVPSLLAVLFVSHKETFHLYYGLLASLGVVLVHMGANLLDDYYDYQCQSVQKRQMMINGGIRARSFKCHYLLSGQTTERRLLLVGLSICLAALLIGVVLWLKWGMPILYFILAGAFLAFFYSAPPLRLSFHGLGEITVGILFGPLVMLGTAWSACGQWDWNVFYLSIPIGLLVANILYTHSILDLGPDREAGKNTLAVLLKTQERAVHFSALLIVAIYFTVVLGVVCHRVFPTALLVLLSLPLAITLWRFLWIYVREPDRRLERNFWMGPMEKWELMKKAGLDWFMIRWYLSRNLLSAFCLLLFVSYLLDRWIH